MVKEKLFIKEMVNELRYVAKKMRSESDYEKAIYYFSAAHGITNRTFRYVFNENVLLADFVLNVSYNMFNDLITRVKQQNISSVPLEYAKIRKISDQLNALADAFEAGRDVSIPLKKILTIAYTTTGNGHYLEEKGMISI